MNLKKNDENRAGREVITECREAEKEKNDKRRRKTRNDNDQFNLVFNLPEISGIIMKIIEAGPGKEIEGSKIFVCHKERDSLICSRSSSRGMIEQRMTAFGHVCTSNRNKVEGIRKANRE